MSNTDTIQIVYTWPDGREEVRHERPAGSDEALQLMVEVIDLQSKHGAACPYSWRKKATPRKSKPCDRCDGDGKAHGSDRPFEWRGPGTYPGPCPKCKGSGKQGG